MDDDTWETAAHIEQAQGMVSAQAGCSLDEALERMRDRATVSHSTVDEIAAAVLDHSIRFGA